MIAVKRLLKMSSQGINQFRNEATLIGKLQHINLVRLLAYATNVEERILIYEHLENLSLDSYLFEEAKSTILNWQRRYDIINGIARGLQYLHQDSRFRIIHRDIKASNILLDKDMVPKISDFGMARLIGRDESETDTKNIVGTFGYLAPEYTRDGIFSEKTDVFSFGVLVLEIITGKRNFKFRNEKGDLTLLHCVWRNWKEGSLLEIVHPCGLDLSSSDGEQVVRCVQIGLMCVQEHPENRPTMGSTVLLLLTDAAIPLPEHPSYCDYLLHHHFTGQSSFHIGSSSTEESAKESWTEEANNNITVSIIEPR